MGKAFFCGCSGFLSRNDFDFVALALTPRDAGSGKAGFSRARGRAYFW